MRAQAARVSPYVRTRIAAHRGSRNTESISALRTNQFIRRLCVVASKIPGRMTRLFADSEFNEWSDLLDHSTDTKAPEARHELAFTTEEVATYAQ